LPYSNFSLSKLKPNDGPGDDIYMKNPQEPEQEQLNSLFLEALAPIQPQTSRQSAMRSSLMQRVTASIAKESTRLTLRIKQGVWQNLTTGIRFKQLWSGVAGRSVLIEFAPGSCLPPHRHHWLEEGIVLTGSLEMDNLKLGPLDYHVSPPGSRHHAIASANGALAYLRGTALGNKKEVLGELITGLLPYGKPQHQTFYAGDQAWQTIADGVERKILWVDETRASCFYRMAAGAKVGSHPHPLEEECLVLAGEIFLDDSLLCFGDYQLAPIGTRHDEIYTDVGATIFVRGARENHI
jgi:quercetin dioxygenase-like cupin family protein